MTFVKYGKRCILCSSITEIAENAKHHKS